MPSKSPTGNRSRKDGKRSTVRRNTVKKTKTRKKRDSSVSQAVGTLFRAAREAQRLSQDQVALLTSGKANPVSRTTISSIERGIHLPGAEVLVSLSRVLNVEPAEVFERIELETTQPVDLTGLSRQELFDQAEEYFWAGDFRRALGTYDVLLQQLVLDPPDDEAERVRLHARIEINRAVSLRRCCALSAARSAAERAISLAADMPGLQTEAYVILATVLYNTGRLPFAIDAADHAVRLAADEGPRAQGMAWIVKGDVLYMSERYEEARQAFLTARAFVRKARDHRHLIQIEGNLGSCLHELGRVTHARKGFARAVELARKYDMPAAEAFWLVELGSLALDNADFDKADSYGRAALRLAKPTAQLLTVFRAEWLLHLVVKAREPDSRDRHRLAHLRKLYPRLKEHGGVRAIKKFEEAYILPEDATGGRDE